MTRREDGGDGGDGAVESRKLVPWGKRGNV